MMNERQVRRAEGLLSIRERLTVRAAPVVHDRSLDAELEFGGASTHSVTYRVPMSGTKRLKLTAIQGIKS